MSTTTTTNLGLVKPTPGTGEYADVSVINSNMDAIDAAVGDVDVSADGSLQSQVDSVRDSLGYRNVSGSQSYTVNANTFTKVDIGLTVPSGYRPMMLVKLDSGSVNCCVVAFTVYTNKVELYIRNVSSSSMSSAAAAEVACVKST